MFSALCSLPVTCLVWCVDKSQIAPHSGLKYDTSFRKFFYRKVEELFITSIRNVNIVADSYGGQDFEESFKTYLDKHYLDLFNDYSFDFSSPAKESMLQVADFVAGTFSKLKSGTIDSALVEAFWGEVRKLKPIYVQWPIKSLVEQIRGAKVSAESYDEAVVNLVELKATSYLSQHANNATDSVVDRKNCIDYLLSEFYFGSAHRYVSAPEMLEQIEFRTVASHGDMLRSFRLNVIQPLRKAQIPIVSCRKGYKLPTSLTEIEEWIVYQAQTYLPMLEMADMMVRNVRLATGEDLLTRIGIPVLSKVIGGLGGDVAASSKQKPNTKRIQRNRVQIPLMIGR